MCAGVQWFVVFSCGVWWFVVDDGLRGVLRRLEHLRWFENLCCMCALCCVHVCDCVCGLWCNYATVHLCVCVYNCVNAFVRLCVVFVCALLQSCNCAIVQLS